MSSVLHQVDEYSETSFFFLWLNDIPRYVYTPVPYPFICPCMFRLFPLIGGIKKSQPHRSRKENVVARGWGQGKMGSVCSMGNNSSVMEDE